MTFAFSRVHGSLKRCSRICIAHIFAISWSPYSIQIFSFDEMSATIFEAEQIIPFPILLFGLKVISKVVMAFCF